MQSDLFGSPAADPAVPIYFDGVHLVMDIVDWADPGPRGTAVEKSPDAIMPLCLFARSIGLQDRWVQNRGTKRLHFDLTTPNKARQALRAGAILITPQDLARVTSFPGMNMAGSVLGTVLRPRGWSPRNLTDGLSLADAEQLAADRNVELLKIFAPGRQIGRRGTAHLEDSSSDVDIAKALRALS